jgi:hypothetical protein
MATETDITAEWGEAKNVREAALEAAYGIEDLDERQAAIEAAKAAWTQAKKALLKQSKGR